MKKLMLGLSILAFSTSLFADNDLCKNLTGTWMGIYNDPSNLFAAGNFPVSLQLQYEKGKVYGYTLPANDSGAGSFGASKGNYLFIAHCKKNSLSQVYFVKNASGVCGDPSKQKLNLANKVNLEGLILPYENAMTGANLLTNLTKQTQASTMDSSLLAQVQSIASKAINTCH
jgi:hypothetical protein